MPWCPHSRSATTAAGRARLGALRRARPGLEARNAWPRNLGAGTRGRTESPRHHKHCRICQSNIRPRAQRNSLGLVCGALLAGRNDEEDAPLAFRTRQGGVGPPHGKCPPCSIWGGGEWGAAQSTGAPHRCRCTEGHSHKSRNPVCLHTHVLHVNLCPCASLGALGPWGGSLIPAPTTGLRAAGAGSCAPITHVTSVL